LGVHVDASVGQSGGLDVLGGMIGGRIVSCGFSEEMFTELLIEEGGGIMKAIAHVGRIGREHAGAVRPAIARTGLG